MKEKISEGKIEGIVRAIESLNKPTMQVEEIQDIIEEKLMEDGKYTLAKTYILYRYTRELVRTSIIIAFSSIYSSLASRLRKSVTNGDCPFVVIRVLI